MIKAILQAVQKTPAQGRKRAAQFLLGLPRGIRVEAENRRHFLGLSLPEQFRAGGIENEQREGSDDVRRRLVSHAVIRNHRHVCRQPQGEKGSANQAEREPAAQAAR